MKLLVDSCVARAVSKKAAEAGHDVVWAGSTRPDPGDEALLAQAAAEGRVIITIDSDFGALVFRDGQTRVGVLRLREASAPALAERALYLLAAHEQDLQEGAFVTDDGDRVRVSRRS